MNNGVTQGQIDRNVLSVAELWLSPHQRETVYQSRFTDRIPYNVEMSLDARSLKDFLHVEILRDEKCQSFDWFLKEIYPGLEMDRKNVENAYQNHLSSNYLQNGLEPLLSQYKKIRSENVQPVNLAETVLLLTAENKPDELALKSRKDIAIPPVVIIKIQTPEEIHLKRVRDDLECIDMPRKSENDLLTPCELLVKNDPDTCKNDYGVMMFGCPATCNLCGNDGKICFDFFQVKCPEWKAEGRCENSKSEMEKKCRVTCGFCSLENKTPVLKDKIPITLVTLKEANQINNVIENGINNIPNADKRDGLNHGSSVQDPQNLNHNALPIISPKKHDYTNIDLILSAEEQAAIALVTTTKIANPYTAQELYKNGQLPDPPIDPLGACNLNYKPHGNLLAHLDLLKLDVIDNNGIEKKIPRIFCGIYTMESNHKLNVEATRETWAKKCDGFVAFSTVDDDTIPAIKILHEGIESYDNMWQKSRSIWKYINAHYLTSFDYFLMGGDDMFYIIENLKHYLMSDEISSYVDSHEGTFLGRRFYPGKISSLL